jgi:PKD repeat protein
MNQPYPSLAVSLRSRRDTSPCVWDFNYDGTTFILSGATTLTPEHVFTTPGTYTVALQVTDSEGNSGLGTITVTVSPSVTIVVNAGPDQAAGQGDTVTFSGSATDSGGNVEPASAQWDFNYNGAFVADPSASGTLTPTHTFTIPGTYLVALQMQDDEGGTGIGLMYVDVSDVGPTVDPGPDQTVNVGSTVSFNATATDPAGPSGITSEQWDFDYDGQNFVADPSANNTLTPTHVYTDPAPTWLRFRSPTPGVTPTWKRRW